MKKIYLFTLISFVFFVSCKTMPDFPPQPNLTKGANTIVAEFDTDNRDMLRDVANNFTLNNYLIDYFSIEDMIIQTKFKKEPKFDNQPIAFQLQVSQEGKIVLKAYQQSEGYTNPISYNGKMNYVWKTLKKITKDLQVRQVQFARIN